VCAFLPVRGEDKPDGPEPQSAPTASPIESTESKTARSTITVDADVAEGGVLEDAGVHQVELALELDDVGGTPGTGA
jgi:hypothetical protein